MLHIYACTYVYVYILHMSTIAFHLAKPSSATHLAVAKVSAAAAAPVVGRDTMDTDFPDLRHKLHACTYFAMSTQHQSPRRPATLLA